MAFTTKPYFCNIKLKNTYLERIRERRYQTSTLSSQHLLLHKQESSSLSNEIKKEIEQSKNNATTTNITDAKVSDFLDKMISNPTVIDLCTELRPRSRLKEKHRYLFERNNEKFSLFNKLGIVICNSGVVSRKEFLETYAAATCIHLNFSSSSRRMADLAAGHGLLGWFLLALDDNDDSIDYKNGDNDAIMINNQKTKNITTTTNKSHHRSRTVICIDQRMPESAKKIADSMLKGFPQLKGRFQYVQANVLSIIPDASCILTSVHACGTLTDAILSIAIDHNDSKNNNNVSNNTGDNSPSIQLAIVPCCHTIRAGSGYQPHPLSGVNIQQVVDMVEASKKKTIQSNNDMAAATYKHEIIANIVDEVRKTTLHNAGYNKVESIQLPSSFTGRNRLILAKTSQSENTISDPLLVNGDNIIIPVRETTISSRITDDDKRGSNSNNVLSLQRRQGVLNMPPIISRIPLADNPDDIAYCQELSEMTTIQQQQRRSKTLSTQPSKKHQSLVQGLSLWISNDDDGSEATATTATTATTTSTTLTNNKTKIGSTTIVAVEKEKITISILQDLVNKCCYTRWQKEKVKLLSSPSTILSTTKSSTTAMKKRLKEQEKELICNVTISSPPVKSGSRKSQLYQFRYTVIDGSSMSGIPRIAAKTIHKELRQIIIEKYGNHVLR